MIKLGLVLHKFCSMGLLKGILFLTFQFLLHIRIEENTLKRPGFLLYKSDTWLLLLKSFPTYIWGIYFSALSIMRCTWFLPCFKAVHIVPNSSSKIINMLVSICSAISWTSYKLAWSYWSCLESEKDYTTSLCTVVHVQMGRVCTDFFLSIRKQAEMFKKCTYQIKV